mmetsp:Transcript_10199/g.12591  ORF Transcript_10199/g.12591 Transcript_10199/m.12591 type:complete len:215 (-) Transcript_10199:1216-1860(-)
MLGTELAFKTPTKRVSGRSPDSSQVLRYLSNEILEERTENQLCLSFFVSARKKSFLSDTVTFKGQSFLLVSSSVTAICRTTAQSPVISTEPLSFSQLSSSKNVSRLSVRMNQRRRQSLRPFITSHPACKMESSRYSLSSCNFNTLAKVLFSSCKRPSRLVSCSSKDLLLRSSTTSAKSNSVKSSPSTLLSSLQRYKSSKCSSRLDLRTSKPMRA